MSATVNLLMTTTKVKGFWPTLHCAQRWWEAWLA
jgi:hypothetical protein